MRSARAAVGGLALITASCFLPGQAVRAMDITSYDRDRAQPASSPARGLLKIYLIGVGEGFKWSNAALASKRLTPLFCAPEQVPLTHENYLLFIDEMLERHREGLTQQQLPVEAILLKALQDRLPCTAR